MSQAKPKGHQPGDVIDEWGNFSKLDRVSLGETMRRFDEEERAAGGRAATAKEFAAFQSEYGPFLPPDGEG
jgi:hypothetical protein